MTQKRYYDASSRPLQPLAQGQVVRMQTPKGYDHLGTVKEVSKEPRSYTIQCNGRTYRRNRRHILPVSEPPPSRLTPEDIDSQNTTTHTQDGAPPAPQTHLPQPESTPTDLPKHTVQSPTKVGSAPYRTRSGHICKRNPRYEQ